MVLLADYIYEGECLQWLEKLPDKCCDIFTDPPYNVGKDYGVWDDSLPEDEYLEFITAVLNECKRVANTLIIYVPKKYNLTFWNILGNEFQEIILTFRPAGAIRFGFSNQYNKLLTNAKPKGGKPVLNVWENISQPAHGVFFRENAYGHPGYTSEAITYRAVMELTNSDVVCDPFMGTGTTAIASLKSEKHYMGAEINPQYISIANRRIDEFKKKLQLF